MSFSGGACQRLNGQRSQLEAELADLPGKIANLSTEGKRLVETASAVTGTARRLLDAKLQETGDQLGRLEARHAEVQRRLALLADLELQTRWVEQCLANFGKVWDTLSPENRSCLVHAIVQRVEVDEPSGDVRAYLVNLAAEPGDEAR